MADKTTNIGLIKPVSEEYFSIGHFNGNSDIIDGEIGSLKSRMDAEEERSSSWEDMTDKPESFPPSEHNHPWDEVTDKPSEFTPSAHEHTWEEVSDKPESFAPDAHTHAASDITDILPLANGGTGAETAENAVKNLFYRGMYLNSACPDANTLRNTGLYSYMLPTALITTNGLNLPVVDADYAYGYLLVLGGYEMFTVQLYFCAYTAEVFFRLYYRETSWGEWKKLSMS